MAKPREKDNLTKERQEKNKKEADKLRNLGERILKDLIKEKNEHYSRALKLTHMIMALTKAMHRKRTEQDGMIRLKLLADLGNIQSGRS